MAGTSYSIALPTQVAEPALTALQKTAVNLQASKDAYIVDSVSRPSARATSHFELNRARRHGLTYMQVRTRSIPLAGEASRAHGLLTTGTTRDVVLAVHAMLGRSTQPLGGPTLADTAPWSG